MRRIIETAPAKINLFLHITGKRPDGYHLLDSLVVFTELADTLTVSPAAQFELRIDGPFADALSGKDNIIAKAAEMMAEITGQPLEIAIDLQKNLPVGAGIGGGSADAAAVLRLLRKYWQLEGLELTEMALKLGADVPACLMSAPARMAGIGEQLTVLEKFPTCAVLLANPLRALATADVFKAFDISTCPSHSTVLDDFHDYRALVSALANTGNDLLAPACGLEPIIKTVLQDIALGDLTGMSGSGATCYSLFATLTQAAAAASEIRAAHPDWWVAASRVTTAEL